MWFSETITDKLTIGGIILNFMPSWWLGNYSIGYGEKMVFDPDYRTDAHRVMRRKMYERYGREFAFGCADPAPCVVAPDFQNAVAQAFLGWDVQYPEDGYPMCPHHADPDEIDKLSALCLENLWDHFPYSEIKKQVLYLNDKFGAKAIPAIPIRGVLNEAFLIQGTELYASMLDEDDASAQKVIDFSYRLLLKQIDENAKSGLNDFMLFNCTVQHVGPSIYKDLLFEKDLAISRVCAVNGGKFSLHHCGNFDAFLDIYCKLENLCVIQAGHTSSIEKLLQKFPKMHIDYIFDSVLLSRGSASDIKEKAREIREIASGYNGTFTFCAIDIEYGAPDDNVASLIEAFRQLWKDLA
jgi:hypothetical protein